MQKTIGNAQGKISACRFLNYAMALMIVRKVMMSTVTYVPKIFAGMSLTDGSAPKTQRYLKSNTMNEQVIIIFNF